MHNARNAEYLGHFSQPKFIKEGHNNNQWPEVDQDLMNRFQKVRDASAMREGEDSPTLERYAMFDRMDRGDSGGGDVHQAREREHEPEAGIRADYSIDDTGERTKNGKRIFKLNRR